jgi:hypothetical protein
VPFWHKRACGIALSRSAVHIALSAALLVGAITRAWLWDVALHAAGSKWFGQLGVGLHHCELLWLVWAG